MKRPTSVIVALLLLTLTLGMVIGSSVASPSGQPVDSPPKPVAPQSPSAEPTCSADQFEPNDGYSTATTGVAGTVTGLSICEGDTDWFEIVLQPGHTVAATITFNHAWGDLDLQLFAADGQTPLVVSASTTNEEALSWTAEGETVQTFYLYVFHFTGTGANPDYTLTINTICTHCFTYQGLLANAAGPLNGEFDLQFNLYENPASGFHLGRTFTETVTVQNGTFTAVPDLGQSAALFGGEARYLEIGVRPSGVPTYTLLAPRQPLLPAPAAHSVPWHGVADPPPGLEDGDHQWPAASGAPEPGTTWMVDGFFGDDADPALTLGSDGRPVASYYDVANGNLKVLHCITPDCLAHEITVVDEGGDVGQNSDIAVGSDGFPIISYYDVGNSDLKVAKCHDLACGVTTITSLDITSSGDSGRYSAVAIEDNGLPIIAYQGAGATLHFARCSNSACTAATFRSTGYTAHQLDMVIGLSFGEPVVAFRTAATGGEIRMLACASDCAGFYVGVTSGESVESGPAMMTRANGLPLVIYYDGNDVAFNVLDCSSTACSSWTSHIIYPPLTAAVPAATLGSANLPVIVAASPSSSGKIAIGTCTDNGCSGVTWYSRQGPFGQPESVAVTVGLSGVPLIITYDGNDGSLDVTDCANHFCMPYWRP